MIGIRQADGSFYEIMGDAQSGHKRLVLSAARTDQHGVRIDLYRSEDGTVVPEGALGSISIDDADGLGYQDIEFRVDLDAEGQLKASAQLPGQPPRTLSVDLSRFRSEPTADLTFEDFGADDDSETEPTTLDLPDFSLDEAEEPQGPRRSDADILGDETLASADLDTLDDSFDLDDPLEDSVPDEAPVRSDADILGDDSLAEADLDTLDDFSFDAETPETRGLDAMAAPETAPEAAPMDFDLGDLDAGFGDGPAAEDDPVAEAAPAEEWERISLDDMEPMEFLDTGAEISSPTKAPKNAEKPSPKPAADHFSMDDDEPLELGDFDSDLSDLPDLPEFGDKEGARKTARDDNDLDQDFLPPPELTESSPWGQGDLEPVPPKAAKEKPVKEKPARDSAPAQDGTIDKTALILSLSALSLLVLLILVLLFLNMIKAPAVPKVQPEVQRWKADTTLVSSAGKPQVVEVDLGAQPVRFEAESVLEVPQALRMARISLTLEAGETVEDAADRFGAPARAEGNQLSW